MQDPTGINCGTESPPIMSTAGELLAPVERASFTDDFQQEYPTVRATSGVISSTEYSAAAPGPIRSPVRNLRQFSYSAEAYYRNEKGRVRT